MFTHLAADPATAVQHVHWLRPLAHAHARRHGNEVVTERLGDEREGARHAQVALDHLQLVVLRYK